MKYASGKYALGICDRCSWTYKLSELKELVVRTKKTNLLVCPTCWEEDHPQNLQGMFPVDDPQALRNPRPDTGQALSRGGWGAGGWGLSPWSNEVQLDFDLLKVGPGN